MAPPDLVELLLLLLNLSLEPQHGHVRHGFKGNMARGKLGFFLPLNQEGMGKIGGNRRKPWLL